MYQSTQGTLCVSNNGTDNADTCFILLDGVGRQIAAELERRIMVIDGAMGTMIQSHKLEEEDFRGEEKGKGGQSQLPDYNWSSQFLWSLVKTCTRLDWTDQK